MSTRSNNIEKERLSKKEEGVNIVKNSTMQRETFKCDYELCGRFFNSKERKTVHERSHVLIKIFKHYKTGIKPYVCIFCLKAFNEKGNLFTHERIHTGEKPYKCIVESCLSSFRAYRHLSEHLLRHENAK